MHRVLILAFLGLMLASAARAADVATRHGYTLPPRCANFSGFYLGGQLGWGYYDTTFSDRDGLGQSIDNGLPNSVNATTSRVNLGPLAARAATWCTASSRLELDQPAGVRAQSRWRPGPGERGGFGDGNQQAAVVRHAAGPNRDRGGQSAALCDRWHRIRQLRSYLVVFRGRVGDHHKLHVAENAVRLDRRRRHRVGLDTPIGASKAKCSICASRPTTRG